ncbi:MAG TPA: hypothetical protein VKZ42_03085 [Flavobacteriaceae bacterium]|nr:hypothetical protein [Flavobacteriaceae bacterium]
MVNNQIKLACLARQHLIVSLLLLVSSINGQNISKYYTSSLQEKGTLYFILPQMGFENSNNKNKLIYDITYRTKNDTVTLNFSYFDKLDITLDSIALVNVNQELSSSLEKLYIETKKSKWHYRYSSQFLFADINTFFNQPGPPKIILYNRQGTVELNIKTKTWKKQSSLIKKILALIKFNK